MSDKTTTEAGAAATPRVNEFLCGRPPENPDALAWLARQLEIELTKALADLSREREQALNAEAKVKEFVGALSGDLKSHAIAAFQLSKELGHEFSSEPPVELIRRHIDQLRADLSREKERAEKDARLTNAVQVQRDNFREIIREIHDVCEKTHPSNHPMHVVSKVQLLSNAYSAAQQELQRLRSGTGE